MIESFILKWHCVSLNVKGHIVHLSDNTDKKYKKTNLIVCLYQSWPKSSSHLPVKQAHYCAKGSYLVLTDFYPWVIDAGWPTYKQHHKEMRRNREKNTCKCMHSCIHTIVVLDWPTDSVSDWAAGRSGKWLFIDILANTQLHFIDSRAMCNITSFWTLTHHKVKTAVEI